MNSARLLAQIRRAVGHHQAGRLDEAARLYGELLPLLPEAFDLVHWSGLAALQQGKLDDALRLLRRAHELAPQDAVCAMRLGAALLAAGQWGAAESALRESLDRDARLPESWLHLGIALWRQSRLDEAVAALRTAIECRPDFAEAHEKLGALRYGREGPASAEPHFRAAVRAAPGSASAWCNLGVCLLYRGELSEALRHFERALAVNPQLAHAHAARGLALERCHDVPGAIDAYGRALAIDPNDFEARSARLLCLQHAGAPAGILNREHREFGERVERSLRAVRPPAFPADADPERALRVGFVSPDFRRHAVASFIEPILEGLRQGPFAVCLYHNHAVVDEVSLRLRNYGEWRHIAAWSDDAVEALVRRDRIDILVDLAGHTGFNRLPLFARRLAPVQVNYLGYPDTTGLTTMDFRLVDAITDPPGPADLACTEKLVRFAPTAWTFAPPSGASQPEATAPGPGGVVFGCFNSLAKVTDRTLALWAAVLRGVPGSRLLLKGAGLGSSTLAAAFRARLDASGIDSGRVELLERTGSVEAHLAAYARMDIALDTFPYQGTTTTCEALWMGVPVVTLLGDRHASRVGASLLTAIGRPEWIAHDEAEYVQIAARLSAAVAGIRSGRPALREAMRRSPLLDHAAQAERFAAALRTMWKSWCARRIALAA